ncbi:hypothetical protein ABZ864_05990 [Streptomyces sp. NPDC047082]|uniref:hypothetical protein n=1 Tax=Streptomyces sp. NPDC047082 TaxID=3155259 RepID=UPI0033EB207A
MATPSAFITSSGKQALVAIPGKGNDQDIVFYSSLDPKEQPEFPPTLMHAKAVKRALELAGAWSDLDTDEVMKGLQRLHDERTISDPLTDEDL